MKYYIKRNLFSTDMYEKLRYDKFGRNYINISIFEFFNLKIREVFE